MPLTAIKSSLEARYVRSQVRVDQNIKIVAFAPNWFCATAAQPCYQESIIVKAHIWKFNSEKWENPTLKSAAMSMLV
jgi:hypothetical protein